MKPTKETWATIKLGALEKQAIALPDLLRLTNRFSIKNRPGCAPTLLESSPADLYLEYNVTCTLANSDPNGHTVKVQFDTSQVKPGSKAQDLDIRLSCSCPAWLYWGAQWWAYQQGYLEGQPRPKLQPPTKELDLRNGFKICKHCKAVSERILPSVQHNIVKILRERDIEQHRQRQDDYWRNFEQGRPRTTPTTITPEEPPEKPQKSLLVRRDRPAEEPTPAKPAPKGWAAKLKKLLNRVKNRLGPAVQKAKSRLLRRP